MITQKLLDETLDTAKQAGAELLKLYKTGLPAESKKDGSVVTAADRDSEAVIMTGLSALIPAMPIVSEESVEAGNIPDISGGDFWCVDPLDGTQLFVDQEDYFSVLIGLVQKGVPTLGVVHLPALRQSWFGAAGVGAWVEDENGRRPISPAASNGQTMIHIYQNKRQAEADEYLRAHPEHQPTIFGRPKDQFPFLPSIISGCRYLYFGSSYEWDTAAPHAILRVCGHDLRQIDGKPMQYGKTPEFKNGDLLAGKF